MAEVQVVEHTIGIAENSLYFTVVYVIIESKVDSVASFL